jgi:hypothetical protein
MNSASIRGVFETSRSRINALSSGATFLPHAGVEALSPFTNTTDVCRLQRIAIDDEKLDFACIRGLR